MVSGYQRQKYFAPTFVSKNYDNKKMKPTY